MLRPILELNIYDKEVISQLRRLPEVGYVEPAGYEPQELSLCSDSGCDVSAVSPLPTACYSSRNSEFGRGLIDVSKAVRG